jgi:ribulose-5-phosphate 4-epimerase/fuculose-1-phosphate aldolase
MIDEGYVKYRSHWQESPALDAPETAALLRWRRPLFAAGLIGVLEDSGIGYGNISHRIGDTDRFLISGTQTGHLAELTETHFAEVVDYDLDANTVTARGPAAPSSEAMTHAAIYHLDHSIRAVVHVHHHEMWLRFRDVLPTTRADVRYGTPDMAREFQRLHAETDFASRGIAVMAGHEDGIVGTGGSMQEATERIITLLRS